MKQYHVTITETLQRTITLEAESKEQAEQLAEAGWNDCRYILTADDFVEVEFEAYQ